MFFILECISFNNILAHMGIFDGVRNIFINIHCWIVYSQLSDQSDHDTRIWYHAWVTSKQSLQALPPLFFPHSTWEPLCGLGCGMSELKRWSVSFVFTTEGGEGMFCRHMKGFSNPSPWVLIKKVSKLLRLTS